MTTAVALGRVPKGGTPAGRRWIAGGKGIGDRDRAGWLRMRARLCPGRGARAAERAAPVGKKPCSTGLAGGGPGPQRFTVRSARNRGFALPQGHQLSSFSPGRSGGTAAGAKSAAAPIPGRRPAMPELAPASRLHQHNSCAPAQGAAPAARVRCRGAIDDHGPRMRASRLGSTGGGRCRPGAERDAECATRLGCDLSLRIASQSRLSRPSIEGAQGRGAKSYGASCRSGSAAQWGGEEGQGAKSSMAVGGAPMSFVRFSGGNNAGHHPRHRQLVDTSEHMLAIRRVGAPRENCRSSGQCVVVDPWALLSARSRRWRRERGSDNLGPGNSEAR